MTCKAHLLISVTSSFVDLQRTLLLRSHGLGIAKLSVLSLIINLEKVGELGNGIMLAIAQFRSELEGA